MQLVGRSKIHKVISILLLLTVLAFALDKSGYIDQVKQTILGQQALVTSSYTISAPEFKTASEEQLYMALQLYSQDSPALEKVTLAAGITLQQFEHKVHSVFIIDEGELTVQFGSDLSAKKLKPVYDYLANDLKHFMLERLRRAANPS